MLKSLELSYETIFHNGKEAQIQLHLNIYVLLFPFLLFILNIGIQ